MPSASLSTAFFGHASGAITDDVKRASVERALAVIDQRGGLYGAGSPAPRETGYDLALLVMALSTLGYERAGEMRGRLIGMADETGTWCEYYDAGVRAGVPCRPWETAIALCAIGR